MIDVVWLRYNRLVILEVLWHKRYSYIVKCKCDCWNIKDFHLSNLRQWKTKSCGCYNKEVANSKWKKIQLWDYIWKVQIIRLLENKKYECKCICWNMIIKNLTTLKNWKTMCKQCKGKIHFKHGFTNSKIYRVFHWIKTRCNNNTNKYYKNYWWRWIKCEWKTFEDFYNDMWDTYKEWLTIDRINVNWNYCKDNCRWITLQMQQKNKTTNIMYKWNCLVDNCKQFNLNYEKIRSQLKRWFKLDEIFKN